MTHLALVIVRADPKIASIRDLGSVLQSPWKEAAQRNDLAQDEIEIEFLDYDWRLNRVP